MEKDLISKAGVVVYRKKKNGEIEVLLISARKHKGSWVFPVGTVEDHETLRVTATRECEEESGYIVEVEDEVGMVKIPSETTVGYYTFYKATVLQETDNYEKDRKRKWVGLDDLVENIADVFLPVAKSFIKNLEMSSS